MQAWQRQRSQELSSLFMKTLGQWAHLRNTALWTGINTLVAEINPKKSRLLSLSLDRNVGTKWRKVFPLTPLIKFTQRFRIKGPEENSKGFHQCLLQPVKFLIEQILKCILKVHTTRHQNAPLHLFPPFQWSEEAPECISHTNIHTHFPRESWAKVLPRNLASFSTITTTATCREAQQKEATAGSHPEWQHPGAQTEPLSLPAATATSAQGSWRCLVV